MCAKSSIRKNHIAILTSKKSWFKPYARDLETKLIKKGYKTALFHHHGEINASYQIVFILSYFSIITEEFLKKHKYNLVVHESDLPEGKGWAPLFWQVIEGKNKIPVVLFEAKPEVDSGDIYLKDDIILEGHELHNEIRCLQARKTIELCLNFLDNLDRLKPAKQSGTESYYYRRTPRHSELDMNKSIKEQFNLLRTVNNEEFPAFFNYKNHKYIIKIYKDENSK